MALENWAHIFRINEHFRTQYAENARTHTHIFCMLELYTKQQPQLCTTHLKAKHNMPTRGPHMHHINSIILFTVVSTPRAQRLPPNVCVLFEDHCLKLLTRASDMAVSHEPAMQDPRGRLADNRE